VLTGAVVAAANLMLSQRVQWRAQVTDRFSKAIEQLGQRADDKLDVRIGAIYALEQIARDSGELHWPIMEVLTAYLREHAPVQAQTEVVAADDASRRRPPADHQAIATVISRRRRWQDPAGQILDLRQTNLSGFDWSEAHLEGANLWRAHLERAYLSEAHLEGAILWGAHLEGAHLWGAHLEGANLEGAYLEGANLEWAHLEGANLAKAHLEGARLWQAHGLGPPPSEGAAQQGEAGGVPPPKS
jgi:uncharacterized protein YjbI with pentapeptide repeats